MSEITYSLKISGTCRNPQSVVEALEAISWEHPGYAASDLELALTGNTTFSGKLCVAVSQSAEVLKGLDSATAKKVVTTTFNRLLQDPSHENMLKAVRLLANWPKRNSVTSWPVRPVEAYLA